MTAAPATPYSPRSRRPVHLLAFVGDATGAAPQTIDDAAPWLIPLSFDRTSGRASNTLAFQVDLDTLGDRYQDITVPVGVDRTVELRQAINGSVDTLIGWGKLATNAITLNDQQESSTVTCVLDPTALALSPVRFVTYYDRETTAVEVPEHWQFNPERNSLIVPNRSDSTHTENGWHYFLSPASVQTQQSLDLQLQNPDRWTLATAVHALCWHCNPDESRLTNPALTDLQSVLDDADRDAQFRNHTIRLGTDLFTALDDLLQRYSCGWYLDWSGAIGSVQTEIKVFARGTGVNRPLLMQRIGDTIDAGRTNTADLQMNFDLATQPNRIHAVSALKQIELQLKLFPGWDPTDEPTPDSEYLDRYDQLARDPDYQLGGKFAHVGRRWVANEAGDYNGFRASTGEEQVIAGTTLRKRRPLLPCLTRSRDGGLLGQRGYVLEWQDFDDNWHVEADAFAVLDDEAGIVYRDVPPIEVWTEYRVDPDHYYLRITATVELDEREEHLTDRRDDSPQGADHWLYLRLENTFSAKSLHSTGAQKSPYYDARRFLATEAAEREVGPHAGYWYFRLSSDPADVLAVGQRIAITNSGFEDVYTVRAIDSTYVTVEETPRDPTADITGAIAWANTDVEDCTERLTAFATQARDDNDYALVAPEISLHGIDHPQYRIGDLVPDAQPRNVQFAGRRDGSRSPQVIGLRYEFHQRQRMTLLLEQYRDASA